MGGAELCTAFLDNGFIFLSLALFFAPSLPSRRAIGSETE